MFQLFLFGSKQSWVMCYHNHQKIALKGSDVKNVAQKWLTLIFLFHAVTASNPELGLKPPNDTKLQPLNNNNNDGGEIEQSTDSSAGSDCEYDSMKRAFNIFNDKMEFYMSFYTNELTLLTNVLSEFKEKMQAIEIIHDKVDRLIERQNQFEMKLNFIPSTITIGQKLDHIEQSLQYLRERIDDLASNAQTKETDQSQASNANNGEQQLNNCEWKIDHLISFVHNFAELDRLESSDVLNRLGNMQSQLIHFFDVKAETRQRPKHNEINLKYKADVINTTTDNGFDEMMGNFTGAEQIGNGKSTSEMSSQLFERQKRKRNRGKRSESDCNESERKLRNCRFHQISVPFHPKYDVDVDLNLFKTHKSSRAKYGAPSQYGCHQFVNISRPDGIYRFPAIQTIQTPSGQIFNERKCSFDTNGVAWTVVQSRHLKDNSSFIPLNFNRSWDEYKNGFGQLNGEFWFGNDFIHRLTYDDDMELKVELESWDNHRKEFIYDIFRVDSETNRYNLFIRGFRGENKHLDAFKYHNNQDFSTFDRQNDKSGINDRQACCSCAKSYASGWWFNNCIEVNLNGVHQQSPYNNNYVGIIWEQWLGDYSLKSSKMLIRPKINWPEGDENDPNSKPPDDP